VRAPVLLHRTTLDAAIAAGADALTDPVLVRRSARLLRRRERRTLAAAVERILWSSRRARPELTAAIPIDRRAVRDASLALAAVAARLRSPEPVTPQGMVLLRRLLTDGTGPLYRSRRRGELGHRVREVAAALAPYVPEE
jgi:hypothetical protein